MQSKGNAPNAVQKRWREAVRALGSVISGAPAVIHHPVGRTGKHNKVHIGHWWVIPLTDQEHKDLHNGLNIWEQSHPDCGIETRKQFEKFAFMYDVIENIETPDEYTYDIHKAIMSYHK